MYTSEKKKKYWQVSSTVLKDLTFIFAKIPYKCNPSSSYLDQSSAHLTILGIH